MKKRMAKKMTALLAVACMTISSASIVSADWVQSHDGRWWNSRSYDASNFSVGWDLINGEWYLFDDDGWMLTGWQRVGSSWYYMDSDGAMLANSWIDGRFYVGKSGAMLTNSWTADGYYVDASGAWVPNASNNDGEWKLGSQGWWWSYSGGGWPSNEWKEIDDEWYYFYSSGYIASDSWYEASDGKWYYFDKRGAMLQASWELINGKWYYFNGSSNNGFKHGEMLHSTWLKSDNLHYYLAADGHMSTDTWVYDSKNKINQYVGNNGIYVPGKTNTTDTAKNFTIDYIGKGSEATSYRWECNYRTNGKNTRYYVQFKSIKGDKVTMNLQHIDKNTGESASQEGIVGTLKGSTISFDFADGSYTGKGTVSLNGDNVFVTASCGIVSGHYHDKLSLCTGGATCEWTKF